MFSRQNLKNYLPLAILLLLIVLVSIFDIKEHFTLATLRERHEEMVLYAHTHPVVFSLSFLAVYIISVILVVPDSTILSLLAGMTFPLPIALLFVIASETIGAYLFYLSIRYAFRETYEERINALLHKLGRGFVKHEIWYLLFFRLSHLLPFWLINALCAIFKTKPYRFVWTAFVGMLPLCFFLVQAGSGLAKTLRDHTSITFKDVFNTQMKLSLLGLGLLALLPILLKKLSKRWK